MSGLLSWQQTAQTALFTRHTKVLVHVSHGARRLCTSAVLKQTRLGWVDGLTRWSGWHCNIPIRGQCRQLSTQATQEQQLNSGHCFSTAQMRVCPLFLVILSTQESTHRIDKLSFRRDRSTRALADPMLHHVRSLGSPGRRWGPACVSACVIYGH